MTSIRNTGKIRRKSMSDVLAEVLVLAVAVIAVCKVIEVFFKR